MSSFFDKDMIFEGKVDQPKHTFNINDSEKTFERKRHEIYTHPKYRFFCRHCGLRGYDSSGEEFNSVKCVYPNNYDLDMFKENSK